MARVHSAVLCTKVDGEQRGTHTDFLSYRGCCRQPIRCEFLGDFKILRSAFDKVLVFPRKSLKTRFDLLAVLLRTFSSDFFRRSLQNNALRGRCLCGDRNVEPQGHHRQDYCYCDFPQHEHFLIPLWRSICPAHNEKRSIGRRGVFRAMSDETLWNLAAELERHAACQSGSSSRGKIGGNRSTSLRRLRFTDPERVQLATGEGESELQSSILVVAD